MQSLQKGASMYLINEEQKIVLNRIGSPETNIDREEASLGASQARMQKHIETLDGSVLKPEQMLVVFLNREHNYIGLRIRLS